MKNSFTLKQSREDYFAELQQSLEDTKNGNVISFTIEEFDAFTKALKNEEYSLISGIKFPIPNKQLASEI